MEEETKVIIKRVAIATVILVAAVAFFLSITIINATNKGLLFEFGAL
jgi:hypothetical protein